MSKRLLASLLLGLTACGGGDGGNTNGEILSLRGPDQIAIIDSSSGSTSALRLPRGVGAVTGSDYETDRTQLWVRDNSMEALDTVNMILTSLKQTRYYEQTNAGAYLALVEQDERGGGERGNSGPVYEEWVVNSTRASNTAAQIVSFWIPQDEEDTLSTIYGKLMVSVEPSDSQPLGRFELFFKSIDNSLPHTSTVTRFEGYLRTVARTDGQTELEFYMGHGDPEGTIAIGDEAKRERVHVVGDPGTESGRAYSERSYARNESGTTFRDAGEFQLQFNATYVARRDVANGNALSVLDRNDFDTRVYRYGVYNATTEQRIAQLSGFPVQDAGGHHGWAGFHGVWFPENIPLTNGQTLYRRSFSSSAQTPYTLVIAPGRLEKSTRSSLTLGDLANEDLEYFDNSAGGELRVRFTGSDFVKVATRMNGEWQPINPPVSIVSSFTTGQWLGFWSQARGRVEFAWPAMLASSVPAIVWASTTLTPDSPELASSNLTVHGYSQLLRANITSNQANFLNNESPYLPNATSVSSGNQTYVFDRDSLLLTLGGDNVTLGTGVTITQGPGQFGLGCGPLFATALSSLEEIANQTVSYQWHIGGNSWNQLRVLKDANAAFVAFDPPTRFTYVHSENGSAFDGRTFFLEWDGTQLHGIPYEQNNGDGRWYPLFNIPSGTTLTSNTYKIKQLEGEQFMVEVNNPNTVYAAQGFDLDTPVSAPTAAPYVDPAIGVRPTVTGAPLYVGGVLQTSGD